MQWIGPNGNHLCSATMFSLMIWLVKRTVSCIVCTVHDKQVFCDQGELHRPGRGKACQSLRLSVAVSVVNNVAQCRENGCYSGGVWWKTRRDSGRLCGDMWWRTHTDMWRHNPPQVQPHHCHNWIHHSLGRDCRSNFFSHYEGVFSRHPILKRLMMCFEDGNSD